MQFNALSVDLLLTLKRQALTSYTRRTRMLVVKVAVLRRMVLRVVSMFSMYNRVEGEAMREEAIMVISVCVNCTYAVYVVTVCENSGLYCPGEICSLSKYVSCTLASGLDTSSV